MVHDYDITKDSNAIMRQKLANLNAKLEAAAQRKAEVRYPPCARVKPAPAAAAPLIAKRSVAKMVKTFVKGAFAAFAGGAVMRLFKFLPFGK